MSLDRKIMLLLMARLYSAKLLSDEDVEVIANAVERGDPNNTISSFVADFGGNEAEMSATAIRSVPMSAAALDYNPEQGLAEMMAGQRRADIRARTKLIDPP